MPSVGNFVVTPSSSGLGLCPFTAATRVRVPSGSPFFYTDRQGGSSQLIVDQNNTGARDAGAKLCEGINRRMFTGATSE